MFSSTCVYGQFFTKTFTFIRHSTLPSDGHWEHKFPHALQEVKNSVRGNMNIRKMCVCSVCFVVNDHCLPQSHGQIPVALVALQMDSKIIVAIVSHCLKNLQLSDT